MCGLPSVRWLVVVFLRVGWVIWNNKPLPLRKSHCLRPSSHQAVANSALGSKRLVIPNLWTSQQISSNLKHMMAEIRQKELKMEKHRSLVFCINMQMKLGCYPWNIPQNRFALTFGKLEKPLVDNLFFHKKNCTCYSLFWTLCCQW